MLGTTLDVRPFFERVGQELTRIDPAEVQALADAIYDCYQHGRLRLRHRQRRQRLQRLALLRGPRQGHAAPRRTSTTTPRSGCASSA